MSTLFISDLHLSENQPEITQTFISFLEAQASDAKALYILGDIFDLWIGDDDDRPLVTSISQRLQQLSQHCDIYLMQGNRDFLLGEQYAKQCSATLLADPTVIDLYGTPTLLMHGDTLCTDDVEYQQYRAMVHTPQWQEQVLSQSLEARRKLADHIKMESHQAKSEKSMEIMDVNAGAVIEAFEAHNVQQLIHGHTHRPAVHQLEVAGKPATRYVLGDWKPKLWWLEANEGGLTLHNRDFG